MAGFAPFSDSLSHFEFCGIRYSAKDTSVPQADVVMETYTAENATLYKVKKDSHFTVISNKLLRSKKLNTKQKGLLLKVLSLPNTWKFSVSGLVKICKEGKSAIKARLAELTELGYLVRTRLKSNESKSRGFEYIYEFFEIALSKEDAEKKSEKTRKNAKKSIKDLFPKKSKNRAKRVLTSLKNNIVVFGLRKTRVLKLRRLKNKHN